MTVIDRQALTAVLRLAAPAAPTFALDAAVNAAINHLGAVATADRLPPPAARPQTPEPAEGQVRVEVVDAYENEYPDSGSRLTLMLRLVDDPDADEIKCWFDARRAVAREIAMKALGGLGEGEAVEKLTGRQAVIEPRSYHDRDGIERTGVAKWIVPRKPRVAAKRAPSAPRPKPESLPEDGDVPF